MSWIYHDFKTLLYFNTKRWLIGISTYDVCAFWVVRIKGVERSRGFRALNERMYEGRQNFCTCVTFLDELAKGIKEMKEMVKRKG